MNSIDTQALKERYCPEGSKLRRNQLELLDMLLDLAAICKEHNIQWWLSSGTLLGAARHAGFIPWDDDIDIVMTRKEAKRLKKILSESNNDKYAYQSIESDIEYTNLYCKFRKLNDQNLKTSVKRHQFLKYRGRFVDIFSIEKTSYFSARAAKVIYYNLQHMTVHIKIKWLRRVMIRFFEFLCLCIVNPLLRIIGLINPRNEYHYSLGEGWAKHTFFMKDTLPLTTAMFEGHEFPVPKNMDAYLTNVYGDWRTLPSEESILKSLHSDEYREEILEVKNNDTQS